MSGKKIWNYIVSNPDTPTLEFPLHFGPDGLKNIDYGMYNVQNYVGVKIGYWDYPNKDFAITVPLKDVQWPGGREIAPNDSRPVLTIALLYPSMNVFG